jgi:hypothetical protein
MKNNKKEQIENYRKVKYQIDKVTGKCEIQDDLRQDLHNGVNILSEQLYSKEIHFVFELIQNAEDNHYLDGVTESLSFELLADDPTNTPGSDGCLAIYNNETGFELPHIKAISSIGNSTKAKSKDSGYIGEKGIGFKSVFVVSESPHIYSNGYQFKFKKHDELTKLGYIIPYWLDERPEVVIKNQSKYTTCILLPLKNDNRGKVSDRILDELKQIKSSVLLFLNKLNNLSITAPNYQVEFSKSTEAGLTVLTTNTNGNETTERYLVAKKSIQVPSDLNEDKREGVKQRDLTLAFPYYDISKSVLYAYLPTELDTGLPFLINADFLLPASRESVLVNVPWNDWIRDEVASFAADTLSDILEQTEQTKEFKWIPLTEKNNDDFLEPIFSDVLDRLYESKIILCNDDIKRAPEYCVFADEDLTRLLAKLSIKDRELTSYFIPEYYRPFEEQICELGVTTFSAEVLQDYLCKGIIDNTSQPVSWFISLYEWLLIQPKYWLSASSIELLKDSPIFLGQKELLYRSKQNIYLNSSVNVELPVLESEKYVTDFKLLDINLQKELAQNKSLNEFIKETFSILTMTQNEYLSNVALPFCKEYLDEIDDNSLWKVSDFVFQNWFSLRDDVKKDLKLQLPFKRSDGSYAINSEKELKLVTPPSYRVAHIWQTVFNEKEKENFIILSDGYLKLFEKYENLDDYDVFSTLGVTSAPRTEKNSITVHRYSSVRDESLNITPDYLAYLNGQFDRIDSTMVIREELEAVPRICLDESNFENEKVRTHFIEWLERQKLRGDYWKQHSVTWHYQYRKRTIISTELFFVLNNLRWLETNNGLKRADEVFLSSETNKELYGNALNFIVPSVKLSDGLISDLGLTSDVSSEAILNVLRSWSNHNEQCDIEEISRIYQSLAGTRADLSEVFLDEALIYCPSGERNWCTSADAIWSSQKNVLGDMFHWLSDYYPSFRQTFWVDTVEVKLQPEPENFASAWLKLQELPVVNEKKERTVRNALDAIFDRLLSYLRKVSNEQYDDWFVELVDNAKCFTRSHQWLDRDDVFVSDDRRLSDLFNKQGIEFFWKSRGKSHNHFETLYEALDLRSISEEVEREVVIDEESLQTPRKTILTEHTRILLACFYKNYHKNETFEDNWYDSGVIGSLLGCSEFLLPEAIDVEYYVDGVFVEDSTDVYFDSEDYRLIYKNDDDDDELFDSLAEEISKLLIPKAFVEQEAQIRLLLGISTKKRLDKLLKKKDWERLLSKEELSGILTIADRREQDDELTEHEVDDEQVEAEEDSIGGSEKSTFEEPSKDNINSFDQASDDAEESGNQAPSSNDFEREESNEKQAHATGSNSSRPSGNSNTNRRNNSSAQGSRNNQRNDRSSRDYDYDENESHESGSETDTNGSYSNHENKQRSSSYNEKSGSKVKGSSSNSLGYRMLSYVDFNEGNQRYSNERNSNAKKTGDKAELLVRDHLINKGFSVSLLGGTNPGYDIEVLDPETAELFLAEVKGIRGKWNRTGFSLSHTQVEKCRQYGDNYWLYIVENIATTPVLYKLVNPVSQIKNYYFDLNWKKVSQVEEFDAEDTFSVESLLADQSHIDVYYESKNRLCGEPEIGFEIQDEQGEIIYELELAWPKLNKGIYIDTEKPELDGWNLRTVDEVLNDISWLDI